MMRSVFLKQLVKTKLNLRSILGRLATPDRMHMSSEEAAAANRKRKTRVVFIGFMLILLFIFTRNYKELLPDGLNSNDHLISFMLINFNMSLILILSYLLLRNIVKIIYERKMRVFGYKLKIKLIISFVTVCIFPAILYVATTQSLFQANYTKWINEKLKQGINHSENIIDAYKVLVADDMRHFGLIMTKESHGALSDFIKFKGNHEFFKYKLFEYRMNGIVIYDQTLSPIERWFDKEESRNIWLPVKTDQIQFQGPGIPQFITEVIGKNGINRSVIPFNIDGQLYYLELIRIDPESEKSLLPTIKESLSIFLSISSLEPLVLDTYYKYMFFLTLLIIFGGVWFALYLAKTITFPIDTLVKATDRIARNNFNVTFPPSSKDEIGKLTEAFQGMTESLKKTQTQLDESKQKTLLANEELLKRNTFIETVLDNIYYGIISFNTQGFVLSVNEALLSMFNIKSEVTSAQHFTNIIPSRYAEKISVLMQTASYRRDASENTNIYGEINGRLRHISLRVFVLKNKEHQEIGTVAVFQDTTEIDNSTRARAWQEVARRIAHEIRNPLTPIQLSVQHLRNKFLNKGDHNLSFLDNSTKTVLDKVELLKHIVGEFEKFARIPEVSLQSVNPEKIVDDVIQMYNLTDDTSISIHKKVIHKPPQMILDPSHISRALINLVKNALEAIQSVQEENSDYRGLIELMLDYQAEAKRITLTVTDNGTGVSLPGSQSIFEPYVTGKEKGTGLGLTIVQRIVADHDGFINYEQNHPQGSIFIIDLPVKTP